MTYIISSGHPEQHRSTERMSDERLAEMEAAREQVEELKNSIQPSPNIRSTE